MNVWIFVHVKIFVTHILQKIYFGNIWVKKQPGWQKVQKNPQNDNKKPAAGIVKIEVFETSKLLELISRKIWVAEKF